MSAAIAIDRTLAALADPHRRRIVDLLSAGPRPAGDLARALDLSPPALSRHLRILRSSGVVEDSHPAFDARVRIYTLRQGPIAELQQWLAEAEAMWTGQLAALKRHVEGEGG